MAPIARGLTESQIKAVAAYVSYLSDAMRSLLVRLGLALPTAILVVAVIGLARADDQHAALSGSIRPN